MKRFRFRLETLLRVREQKEKLKQREFAEEVGKVTEVQDQIDDIEKAIADTLETLGSKAKIGYDPQAVLAYYRYIFNMQRYSAARSRHLETLMVEYDKKREELVQASRDKRVLENLKKRHHETWRHEVMREDQIEMDEIGNMRAAHEALRRREGGCA
ncbi:MAG: flagellar export protein FliJ [Planctomycetota bacterium]|nr:MAG: flagellar export protein FliJ [Planctomycetota bacterium]